MQGTGESAAHADICPALGYGVVRLGKKDADEVVGGLRRYELGEGCGRGLLRVWVGLGQRLPYRRSSQGSDRGIRWGLGH